MVAAPAASPPAPLLEGGWASGWARGGGLTPRSLERRPPARRAPGAGARGDGVAPQARYRYRALRSKGARTSPRRSAAVFGPWAWPLVLAPGRRHYSAGAGFVIMENVPRACACACACACVFCGGSPSRSRAQSAHRRARTQRVETVLSGQLRPHTPTRRHSSGRAPGRPLHSPSRTAQTGMWQPRRCTGSPRPACRRPRRQTRPPLHSTVRTALVRAPPPPETAEGGAPPRGVR